MVRIIIVLGTSKESSISIDSLKVRSHLLAIPYNNLEHNNFQAFLIFNRIPLSQASADLDTCDTCRFTFSKWPIHRFVCFHWTCGEVKGLFLRLASKDGIATVPRKTVYLNLRESLRRYYIVNMKLMYERVLETFIHKADLFEYRIRIHVRIHGLMPPSTFITFVATISLLSVQRKRKLVTLFA